MSVTDVPSVNIIARSANNFFLTHLLAQRPSILIPPRKENHEQTDAFSSVHRSGSRKLY